MTISGCEQKENCEWPLPRNPICSTNGGCRGLTQAEGIVTRNEERALIASIDATKLSPFRFHGWLGKRMTASFGWNYDFETAALRADGTNP